MNRHYELIEGEDGWYFRQTGELDAPLFGPFETKEFAEDAIIRHGQHE